MRFTDTPVNVVFYEKPGCAGNAKQKKLLQNNNIEFITKSILDTPWEKRSLEEFFQNLPKEEIINKFAPQIKNNQLDISTISKDELINQMCQNPILIKRPLLEIGKEKLCGFDIDKINQLLHSSIKNDTNISTCQKDTKCTQN